MRMKTVVVLAVVTVPAVALALALPGPRSGEEQASMSRAGHGGALLLGLAGHVDTLARIDIAGPDGVVTLSRTPVAGKPGEGWGLASKGGYKVAPDTIRPIINLLASLHGIEPKSQNPDLYRRLDLADPGHASLARLVTVASANGGAMGSIILGKIKGSLATDPVGKIYARVPASNQTWLAAPAINLPGDALDWVDRNIVDYDEDKVKEVVLTQPGAPPLTLARDHAADKLAIQGLPAGMKAKSETPGGDVQGAFSELTLDDVKPQSQLGGSEAGTVHVVTFDGANVDFVLRKDNGQTWATVSASGNKAAQEIAAKTAGWAYEIPADHATPMLTTLSALTEAVAPIVKK